MSYLFPIADSTDFGVVEVGANILVANGVISIPQSVATTANITFENITANSNVNVAGNVTVVNNIGAVGNISGSALFDSTNRVITKITPTANTGISISSVTSNGPNASFTVTNTGVISLIAGTGIALSGANGNVTVSATETPILSTKGVSANYTLLASDDYVGATTGSITLTLPAGVTGQQYILKNEGGSGACTVAATAPDTIDGSASKSLNSNASMSVVFRAGAWRII